MHLTLPIPSADAQAHSQALIDFITARIADAGGWISFAEYMSLALYAPGLGYYSAGARKFGAEGDFVTAPELTPLFGRAMAGQAAEVLGACAGDILELGAGSGRLAVDMLQELDRLGCLPGRYYILEVSPDLRQRQQARLAEELPHLLDKVSWLERLPERFAGFIVANEVLDALPVHLVHWHEGKLFERGCVFDVERGFGWQDKPQEAGSLYATARCLPEQGDDYQSEINLAAPALISSLAECMVQGLMVFIDYGFPRAEYYHPDRDQGTLMCHYRHAAFDGPFVYPGLVDITAHVDFTAVADAGLDAGLDVVGYTTQAHFLINCGVLELLRPHTSNGSASIGLAGVAPSSPALPPGGEGSTYPSPSGRGARGAGASLEEGDDNVLVATPASADYLRQSAAVQKLIQPSEMGELFKVIGLAKGLDFQPKGFLRGDKRHTL